MQRIEQHLGVANIENRSTQLSHHIVIGGCGEVGPDVGEVVDDVVRVTHDSATERLGVDAWWGGEDARDEDDDGQLHPNSSCTPPTRTGGAAGRRGGFSTT